MALELHGHATLGCRKIVRVLEVFAKQVALSIPHHTTVRQWIIRHGCHSLQTPLNHADDWICIGDLTISVGKLKCLAVLGVQWCNLEAKSDLTLSHKDVELLGLYPTEKSTGNFIEEALEDSAKRIGGHFLATVIDQGSDIKKGANQFQQNHHTVKVVHDISHKLSNVVEHELRNDTKWSDYIQQLNLTRRRVFQTEFAALMPKKQREKGRFMDISHLVYWPERILKSKLNGSLREIPEERYEDYLGWLEGFVAQLEVWGFMVGIVNLIKETVRIYGLSVEAYLYLEMYLEEASIKENGLQQFIFKVLNTVWEEVEKLDEGQTLICSTEVLESIFGKYKAINEGLHGITSNILGISTFVGKELNENEIKEMMEESSVKTAMEWVGQKFGKTLASLRRRFFPIFKKTEFDTGEEVVFTY